MSVLRRKASSDGSPSVEPAYVEFEDIIGPLPRVAYENWELRLAVEVVELWVKVRPGVGFGPIGRDFAEASASERAAAHEIFLGQGLLLLHSYEVATEFLIVKTDAGALPQGAGKVLYRGYYGCGDGSYRSLETCDTLKDVLMAVWALQQVHAPLPKPVAVR